MKTFYSFVSEQAHGLIERHPSVGYVGAITPTATGFWALLDGATKLGAFASVTVGLCVGLLTWRVQRLNAQRATLEIERLKAAQPK